MAVRRRVRTEHRWVAAARSSDARQADRRAAVAMSTATTTAACTRARAARALYTLQQGPRSTKRAPSTAIEFQRARLRVGKTAFTSTTMWRMFAARTGGPRALARSRRRARAAATSRVTGPVLAASSTSEMHCRSQWSRSRTSRQPTRRRAARLGAATRTPARRRRPTRRRAARAARTMATTATAAWARPKSRNGSRRLPDGAARGRRRMTTGTPRDGRATAASEGRPADMQLRPRFRRANRSRRRLRQKRRATSSSSACA